MTRRREYYIKCQSKWLLNHSWNKASQQLTAELKTRIGVDFDQPNIVAWINHEVKTKYFKVMLGIIGVELQIGRFDCIKCNCLHFWIDHLSKAKLSLSICWIHISLKFIVRNLISFLVLAISIAVLLNSIICKMNDRFSDLRDVVFVWGSSDVSLTIPISSHYSMKPTYHHVVANIELSILVK